VTTQSKKGSSLVKNGIASPLPKKIKRELQGSTSVLERLSVQHDYLGHIDKETGKTIMKQSSQCCRYGIPYTTKVWKTGLTSQEQTYGTGKVDVDFYDNGAIRPRGTVKCKGLECSWCGRGLRKELAEFLEMALQDNAYHKGENVFGTFTQQASSDPKVISACSRAMSQVLRKLDKWNKKNKCEIGMFSTQETLFSAVPKVIHYRGGDAFTFAHTYHSHLHFILLIKREDQEKKERLLKLLRDWWYTAIEKFGGVVYDVKGEVINYHRSFRIEEWVDEGKATSRYITKHLKSMELVYAETKDDSKNISLEELKAVIYRGSIKIGDETKEVDIAPFVSMLRAYYKELMGHSRFKSTKSIIQEHIFSHKARLDELRTAEAYRRVVGTNFTMLTKLNKTHEVVLVSNIKSYSSSGLWKEGGHTMGFDDGDFETLTEEFPLLPYEKELYKLRKREPTKQELRWRKITKLLKQACDEKGLVWSGDTLSLVKQVRETEVEMFKNEEWPYVLPYNEGREKAVVVQTISFPNHLYNWLSNERILIPVLYRLRNYILKKFDEVFYEFMNHIIKKVTRQNGIMKQEDKEGVYKALMIGKEEGLMIGSVSYDGRVF
jgi:hypothetical protein